MGQGGSARRPKKKTRRGAGFERYLRYRGDNWCRGIQRDYRDQFSSVPRTA